MRLLPFEGQVQWFVSHGARDNGLLQFHRRMGLPPCIQVRFTDHGVHHNRGKGTAKVVSACPSWTSAQRRVTSTASIQQANITCRDHSLLQLLLLRKDITDFTLPSTSAACSWLTDLVGHTHYPASLSCVSQPDCTTATMRGPRSQPASLLGRSLLWDDQSNVSLSQLCRQRIESNCGVPPMADQCRNIEGMGHEHIGCFPHLMSVHIDGKRIQTFEDKLKMFLILFRLHRVEVGAIPPFLLLNPRLGWHHMPVVWRINYARHQGRMNILALRLIRNGHPAAAAMSIVRFSPTSKCWIFH